MQGRWEWMTPTVEALARRFRATYSLCGEPGAPPLEPSFTGDLARLDDVCRALGPEPVVLVGVSFGGRLAVHFAARHPDRVRALVLADDVATVAAQVTVPTLIVTGDDALDCAGVDT